MSQSEKSFYYGKLKDAGVNFELHYREYSTEELKAAWEKLEAELGGTGHDPAEGTDAPSFADVEDTMAGDSDHEPSYELPPRVEQPPTLQEPVQQPEQPQRPEQVITPPDLPRIDPNALEMAGRRLNTQSPDEPIGVDDKGLIWYQVEVRKPSHPQPRGRRVLQYMETGTEQKTVQNGEFTETFEVAGKGAGRPAQVKITLPSYQVGIYKDPRFPWRVHIYNETRGFDLFDVQNYFGGPELVPAEIKRTYVEGSLCYDIRTTIQYVQNEYRRLQLAGKVR